MLDALKDPVEGYYDPRDPFTTVPRASVLATPYASHVATSGARGALEGIRLGVIRESMLIPPGSMTEVPIVTAAAREIKDVLGAHLGATLVESADPLWAPDPELEPMKTDFRRALARLVPVFMPDLLFRLGSDGQPVFRRVRGRDRPDRVHAGQDRSAAARCSRSTIASRWRKDGSRRRQTSISPPSSSSSSPTRSVSTSRST